MSLWSEIKIDAAANGPNYSANWFSPFILFFTHSGFQLLMLYRLERSLRRYGLLGKAFGRMIRSLAVVLTACHVSPNAIIAPGVVIPHATGIVIGEGVVIESGARIYQQVTIGQVEQGLSSYPIIEKNAVLYAGAKVLGSVNIGAGAKVAANAVVLKSVLPNVVVGGVPAKTLIKTAEKSK